jgi:hypothetical protein
MRILEIHRYPHQTFASWALSGLLNRGRHLLPLSVEPPSRTRHPQACLPELSLRQLAGCIDSFPNFLYFTWDPKHEYPCSVLPASVKFSILYIGTRR